MAIAVNERMLDKEVVRNRVSRTLLGITILGSTIGILLFAGITLGALVHPIVAVIGGALAVYAAGHAVVQLLPWVTAQVDYTWGLVTQNMLTGNPVIYLAGWHWKYPWEAITEESNIDLKDRTNIHEKLTIATKTDELIAKISFQWRPEDLATFYSMGETVVQDGLFEPILRFVSALFARLPAEDAKLNQSVISRLLLLAFKNAEEREERAEIAEVVDHQEMFIKQIKLFQKGVKDLEGSFGIHVVQVNISDLDFSDDVQSARAARTKLTSLQEMYYQEAGGKAAYLALSSEERAQLRKEMRVLSGDAREEQINITGAHGGLLINAGNAKEGSQRE